MVGRGSLGQVEDPTKHTSVVCPSNDPGLKAWLSLLSPPLPCPSRSENDVEIVPHKRLALPDERDTEMPPSSVIHTAAMAEGSSTWEEREADVQLCGKNIVMQHSGALSLSQRNCGWVSEAFLEGLSPPHLGDNSLQPYTSLHHLCKGGVKCHPWCTGVSDNSEPDSQP